MYLYIGLVCSSRNAKSLTPHACVRQEPWWGRLLPCCAAAQTAKWAQGPCTFCSYFGTCLLWIFPKLRAVFFSSELMQWLFTCCWGQRGTLSSLSLQAKGWKLPLSRDKSGNSHLIPGLQRPCLWENALPCKDLWENLRKQAMLQRGEAPQCPCTPGCLRKGSGAQKR